jgi:predicted metal-binding protein
MVNNRLKQSNLEKELVEMADIERIETIIHHHGYDDFKWLDPRTIVVSQWVRLKCEYGCPSYGRIASCPPNTPSVEECRRFFSEYATGIVFHIQKVALDRDARRAWSAKTNANLVKLERDVFLTGYPKAFLLFMDSCEICAECTPDRKECKEPKLSRPSPEGMAVDMFLTIRQLGYPMEVLTDLNDQMNRYAFLMIE